MHPVAAGPQTLIKHIHVSVMRRVTILLSGIHEDWEYTFVVQLGFVTK